MQNNIYNDSTKCFDIRLSIWSVVFNNETFRSCLAEHACTKSELRSGDFRFSEIRKFGFRNSVFDFRISSDCVIPTGTSVDDRQPRLSGLQQNPKSEIFLLKFSKVLCTPENE